MNALKQTINRANQTVKEKFGDAVKTEYDPETVRLLKVADDLKLHTEKIIAAVQVYLQPDPAINLLSGLIEEGSNKPEQVAQEMTALGNKLGGSHKYGSALLATADTFNAIGKSERDFLSSEQNGFIVPMKRFLQEDLKQLDKEREKLNGRRLDMDALKNKVKNSKEVSVPLNQQLEKVEKEFKEQEQKVNEMVRKMEDQLPELRKHLKSFVERHMEHTNNVNKALGQVHQQL